MVCLKIQLKLLSGPLCAYILNTDSTRRNFALTNVVIVPLAMYARLTSKIWMSVPNPERCNRCGKTFTYGYSYIFISLRGFPTLNPRNVEIFVISFNVVLYFFTNIQNILLRWILTSYSIINKPNYLYAEIQVPKHPWQPDTVIWQVSWEFCVQDGQVDHPPHVQQPAPVDLVGGVVGETAPVIHFPLQAPVHWLETAWHHVFPGCSQELPFQEQHGSGMPFDVVTPDVGASVEGSWGALVGGAVVGAGVGVTGFGVGCMGAAVGWMGATVGCSGIATGLTVVGDGVLGIEVGAGNTGISVGLIATVGDIDGVASGALVGFAVGAFGATMQGPGRG
jgi:hypothetical protein